MFPNHEKKPCCGKGTHLIWSNYMVNKWKEWRPRSLHFTVIYRTSLFLKSMRINYITVLWNSYQSPFTGREIHRQRNSHLGGAGSKESSAAPASRTIILRHQSPSLSISHSSRTHHSLTPACECVPPMSYLCICHNGPHPQLTVGRQLLKAGAAVISIHFHGQSPFAWSKSLCPEFK